MGNIKSIFIISCIPSEIAEKFEPILANQGKIIFSNASTFRMDNKTPLLIPEINKNHLHLIKEQKTPGKIITNPNCSVSGIALAIAPLLKIEKIKLISIFTMQS